MLGSLLEELDVLVALYFGAERSVKGGRESGVVGGGGVDGGEQRDEGYGERKAPC